MKARVFIIVVFPFILLWAVLHRLGREARSAVHMAWLDARMEIHEARRVWRAGRLDRQGE